MSKALLVLLFILSFITLAFSQMSSVERDYVNQTLYPSTALLYTQTESGGMDMRCTATAIEQTAQAFTFVTASHCGCVEDKTKNVVSPEKTNFFISPDFTGNKIYLKATPVGCGYRSRGDDFFLLETDTTIKFPLVPLGRDPKLMDAVINVGGPLGLGKQVFVGTVSSPVIDRPIIEDDINWQGAILLQIFGINGGSSGSSMVCVDQHAICGFIVGAIAETSMVAIPVSRFVKFRTDLKSGNYRWYRKDVDQAPAVEKAVVPSPPVVK